MRCWGVHPGGAAKRAAPLTLYARAIAAQGRREGRQPREAQGEAAQEGEAKGAQGRERRREGGATSAGGSHAPRRAGLRACRARDTVRIVNE